MASVNTYGTITYIQGLASAISEVRGVIPPSDQEGATSFVFKEPVGPVLVIAPWNAPLLLAMRAIAAVLVTGCTAVLKSSETSPACHHLIYDLFQEAGAPPGIFNILAATRTDAAPVTEALISHKHIRKVDFIGSASVGRIVAGVAGKHLKPCILELGGKGPCIVLEDADLDKAAVLATRGALLNNGQVCMSTERIIVLRSVSEPFIEKLVAHFRAAKTGHATTERFAKHAYDIVKDAKDKGVKFLVGDGELSSPSSLKPALLQIDPKTAVDSIRIIDEETFGPSATVYVVEDENEAVELANRTAYGLNAAIHTKDLARGLRLGRELEYGTVNLNDMTVGNNCHAPCGGCKASGWGRTNGIWSLENFLEERAITWH